MHNSATIPTARAALPLLGHIAALLRDPLGFFGSLPEQGDLVRIRLGPIEAVVVCDPDLTRRMLREDRAFDKGGPFYDRGREVIGNNLVTCPSVEHRRQRRLAQPAFHHSRFPGYAEVMADQAAAVTDGWHDGQVLEVFDEMVTITSKTLTATMFSDALSPRVLGEALNDVRCLVDEFTRRAITPKPLRRLPTPGNRRFDHAQARLRRTLDAVTAERRSTEIDHADLLSALIAAVDTDLPDGSGFLSDTELSNQTMMFFLAGSETTASALSWALHLVAAHPAIEQRLYEEVDRVLAGQRPAHTHLPELTLTTRVITEALRLWPPAWVFTRTTTADTELGTHPIPAGTTLVYSPFLIHRNAELYDKPETFEPDRWDPARPQPPRNAFIPFGDGPRKCIGEQFSLDEAVITLATIFSRWRLEHLPGPPIGPAVTVTLRPRGLRMRAIARTS